MQWKNHSFTKNVCAFVIVQADRDAEELTSMWFYKLANNKDNGLIKTSAQQ